MKRLVTSLIIAITSAVAVFIGSPPALATLSINATRTTATAGAFAWIDSTAGRTVSCTSGSLVDTIATNGIGTITNQAFASCRELATGLALTFSNPSGGSWKSSVTTLLSGSQITGALWVFTIPANTAHYSASIFCDFDISGTQAALVRTASTTPPALFQVGSLAIPGSGALGASLGLRLSNVTNGCSIFGIAPGDALTATGTFVLSPFLRGTLI